MNSQLFCYIVVVVTVYLPVSNANLPPVFTHEIDNLALSESTPVGKVVYTLTGYDPEGNNVSFGLIGTDHFSVDPFTGNVTLIKALDKEEHDTLTFSVTIKDRVNASEDSENDNLVAVPATVIVLDENDNPPKFENIPYEAEVSENAHIGTTVFNKILVIDQDSVGENLDINCIPLIENPNVCSLFKLEVTENTQNILKANLILNGTLNSNQRVIYHFQISATDGLHASNTNFEIRVKDVQNSPPVFQGSLSAVIDEDSPIGTLVLKVKAKDGDTGEPRKIVYDLLTNPMNYFLLDSNTGELRTARPLDREALTDTIGLIELSVCAREVVDGIPGNDNLTTAISQISITIKDVNDSPPEFDRKEYNVSLIENSPPGTPLALEMTVTDKDVGENSVFTLRLSDITEAFQVEPEIVRGSSQVNLRVGKKILDYENPNQRRFIILVIAEELNTNPKLSSTATVTISVLDANDNRPVFDQESYSASIIESAQPGKYITTITAKDIDSGIYGDLGIRYTLSGSGSELFDVNNITGVITLADCNRKLNTSQIGSGFESNNYANDTYVNSFDTNNDTNTHAEMKYAIISEENSLKYSETIFHNQNIEMKKPKNISCLDYETQNTYFLSYKAADDNGKGQTSIVSLRILVTDANDSPPVCDSRVYRASIDEGSTTFEPPLIVKGRDVDLNSDITYSIIGNDLVQSLFEIDKRNGQINIKPNVSLDVNNLKTDFIVFDVQVHDGIFSANCLINITIKDVNNHAPQFVKDSYTVSVLESTEIGTKIEQIRAIDLDINNNAEIKYRIQQGNFDDFSIDENSGVVSVSRKLDYDRHNSYKIEIIANDLGTPRLSGTTTLTVNLINVNDKDPYFTPVSQRAEVREDAVPGTIIHKLSAYDPDIINNDALEFAATEPLIAINKDGKEIKNTDNLRDIFSITRKGNVILNKKLDRDLFSLIRITVLVTDSTASIVQQGKGELIISVIDVNEMIPKFPAPWTTENPIIKLQIMEEVPIGSTLTTIQAYDEDSSIDSYSISENDYFVINKSTGLITTKARIDYEEIEEIDFKVTVSDTGIPVLTSTAQIIVDVININDNGPIFLKQNYSFNVLEHSIEGTVIGKVEAKDYDTGILGEITYSLVGENIKNCLLDSDTGIIMVANSSFFDREKISNVKLIAVATDKAPVPTQKSSTVPVFINILDINDNGPIFLQKTYSLDIAENVPLNPPAALIQVKAEDKDKGVFGDVRYLIIDGNDQNLFELDYVTGILYPKQNLLSKQGKYNLTVEARDLAGAGPFRSKANIIINVFSINQQRPVFVNPSLTNTTIEYYGDSIKEGQLITIVKAVDNDEGENGRISYHLQMDNKNTQETDKFFINETTGELWTTTKLLRNEQSVYNLILVARDHGSPSEFETLQFLKITLIDINENRPEFSETSNPYKMFITENSGRDIKVGKIQAQTKQKDKTQQIYYYMILGNEDSAFYLDKISGIIFTNKSLDRELTDFYTLYILASNNPDLHISEAERIAFSIKSLERNRSVAKIQITVLDENDNAPIFSKNMYYAGVNFKAPKNEIVITVNATDKDFGKNGTIEYIITGSNLYKFGSIKPTGLIIPNPFSISQSGEIITSTFMNEYNQDRFELDVIAKEIEIPERFAKAKIYIWVFDPAQLIRIILSRPPVEIHQEKYEIAAELQNTTKNYIIIDEVRYHIDSEGRIRMDWCDIFFHAVDPLTKQIVSVDNVLKLIDMNYDYLKDYYAGYAIENIVPAYTIITQGEFDFTLAALVALIVILFIGVISFVVLCCCLKHWNISIPLETHKEDALIKKQIIEDLNTTENPLWIEQKLKLYEEQELTMQVFSEPDHFLGKTEMSPVPSERRHSVENSQNGENTYATITPRKDIQNADIANYATLRNNEIPSVGVEFTGSTFQVPLREKDDVTELELI